MKSILVEDKEQFILHIQWHGWGWPGDARSQDIISHGVDFIIQEYKDSLVTDEASTSSAILLT